jgi:hypothetical protein
MEKVPLAAPVRVCSPSLGKNYLQAHSAREPFN